jgi:F0F1-type ATP synthase membrane subunit b/b'
MKNINLISKSVLDLIKILGLNLIISYSAYASGDGGGHHGSVLDLIPAYVNFLIFISLIFWKIKGPVKNFFENHYKNVSESLEVADFKYKDAALKYENYKRKVSDSASECEEIQKLANKELDEYITNLKLEFKSKLEKFKADSQKSLEKEKADLVGEVYGNVLNLVFTGAKNIIMTDENSKSKISKNILKVVG